MGGRGTPKPCVDVPFQFPLAKRLKAATPFDQRAGSACRACHRERLPGSRGLAPAVGAWAEPTRKPERAEGVSRCQGASHSAPNACPRPPARAGEPGCPRLCGWLRPVLLCRHLGHGDHALPKRCWAEKLDCGRRPGTPLPEPDCPEAAGAPGTRLLRAASVLVKNDLLWLLNTRGRKFTKYRKLSPPTTERAFNRLDSSSCCRDNTVRSGRCKGTLTLLRGCWVLLGKLSCNPQARSHTAAGGSGAAPREGGRGPPQSPQGSRPLPGAPKMGLGPGRG